MIIPNLGIYIYFLKVIETSSRGKIDKGYKMSMSWYDKWKQTIFSGQKQINLELSHGYKCHWHNLRKELKDFSSRQMSGGSIMVWGAFAHDEFCNLMRIS